MIRHFDDAFPFFKVARSSAGCRRGTQSRAAAFHGPRIVHYPIGTEYSAGGKTDEGHGPFQLLKVPGLLTQGRANTMEPVSSEEVITGALIHLAL